MLCAWHLNLACHLYSFSLLSPCLSFCLLSSLLHANSLTHTLIYTLLVPHSLFHSLTHSLTPRIKHKHTHTHTYSSGPEGSNRGYVSVSLPSPCPHVSLQQISGQRCRKSGFWGWQRRTKVCVCVCEKKISMWFKTVSACSACLYLVCSYTWLIVTFLLSAISLARCCFTINTHSPLLLSLSFLSLLWLIFCLCCAFLILFLSFCLSVMSFSY